MRYLVLALLCLVIVSCDHTDPADVTRKLTHPFEGRGVKLTLKHVSGDKYTGVIQRNGASMPLEATRDGVHLDGEFEFNGARFPFTAEVRGDHLIVHTAGEELWLADMASNPLTGTSAAPSNIAGGNAATPPPNPLAGAGTTSPPANPLANNNALPSNAAGQPFGESSHTMTPPPAATTPPPNSLTSSPTNNTASSTNAKSIQVGVQYDGPCQLVAPSTGISFDIPANWAGQITPGITAMILAAQDGSPYLGIAWAQAPADEMDIRGAIGQTIDLGEGQSLVPSNLHVANGNISADIRSGGQGVSFTGRILGKYNNQAAVAFLVVGPSGDDAKVDQLLNTFLNSVKFTLPKPNSLAGELAQYRSLLGGARLSISSSETFDGGFVQSGEHWDFCSNGQCQFITTGNVGVSVDTPNYNASGGYDNTSGLYESNDGNSQGQWSLNAVGTLAGDAFMVLIMDHKTGPRLEFIAPTNEGVWFAGRMWSADESPVCQ